MKKLASILLVLVLLFTVVATAVLADDVANDPWLEDIWGTTVSKTPTDMPKTPTDMTETSTNVPTQGVESATTTTTTTTTTEVPTVPSETETATRPIKTNPTFTTSTTTTTEVPTVPSETETTTVPTSATQPTASTTVPTTTKAPETEATTTTTTTTTTITTTTACRHASFNIVGKVTESYFVAGNTGDMVCANCGYVIKKGEVTPKLVLKTPKFKLIKGKKQFKVKYTKVANATGFQVRYRIKGKWKVKTYNTKKTVTKVIKKLKKGTYKVQVRALVKQGKQTAYSVWSKAQKVKVK